jgi:EmrB/QacA subfamily drug resistance transporter
MRLRYRSARGRFALIASILGSGMAFVDATAVNVALPAIEADLRTGFAGLQWILNGYLLALASLVLPGGSLGDRYGRRRVFLAGLIGFTAASVLCGLAPTAGVLIGARVLQGIAAALLVPASLAMVQGAFEPDDRSEAIGAWSGFSGLSTIVGPLLGGWLVDAISWRLVFLINPLLAIAAGVMAWRWMPESKDERARRLDPWGTLAAAASLGGTVFALIEGPEMGWNHPTVFLCGLAGVVGLAAFVIIEQRVHDPMLPLGFLRRMRFAGVTMATVPVYFALGGVMFLLALQLQRVLGYSALAAGASLAPVTLMLLVLSPPAGRIASRIGPRLPMTAGPLVAAVGVALMSNVDAHATYAQTVLPAVLVFGLGLGFTVAPLTATAMAALEDQHAGLASGLSNAVTRAAQLLAISVLPLAAGIAGIDRVGGETFSEGFARAMWIGAAVMSAGGIIACATIRGPLQPDRRAA